MIEITRKNNELNKFEKLFLFIYFLITIGFYNEKYLLFVNILYFLLFTFYAYSILSKRRILHYDYIKITIALIIYCYISSLWAVSSSYALEHLSFLLKYALISIAITGFCRTAQSTFYILKAFIFSGIIYCVLFYTESNSLTNILFQLKSGNFIDVESKTNLNILGIIASVSTVSSLFFSSIEKKKYYIVLFIIGLILTFIIGSRKSIISTVIGILIFLVSFNHKSRYIYIGILVVVLIIITEYFGNYFSLVFERFIDLGKLTGSSIVLSESDYERRSMITHGLNYFISNPIFGNGFYNYAILYNSDLRILTYAHNNYVELLVDIGIIGFILFYYIYYLIIKRLSRKGLNLHQKLLLALLIMTLFNHIAIVVIIERFSWILQSILFVGSKFRE